MPSYWLIKAILVLALLILIFFMLKPVKTAQHQALRRLGTLFIIVLAVFAVLFPHFLNQFATLIGVERGINLLVYFLTIAFFAQMMTSYRRSVQTEHKLTQLARAVALQNAQTPPVVPSSTEASGFSSDSPGGTQ
ncbi:MULTISPECIES: DUF2304 domain-containing protein [unclassified Schaalia]|uniref:DUF2304 domain-containing protein n=1 Tax=unclassified Schaalia TaxID=2691889 RepID=UPI001E5B5E85|nr:MULTISPECIES: DUF2304 domain-containing protein [unclassified Schaalia]MCD4549746.1 DUF2304 domain-containing protein [Schaalia sp. lx-260]MCD4556762.1 DUF2304 domain-containing protein [Schaalia sp. lx-100]